MDSERLQQVVGLIARRNTVETEIAAITGRPALIGHLGEWIAAEVLETELEASATPPRPFDGRVASGPLAGATVNVKWCGKREGLST